MLFVDSRNRIQQLSSLDPYERVSVFNYHFMIMFFFSLMINATIYSLAWEISLPVHQDLHLSTFSFSFPPRSSVFHA